MTTTADILWRHRERPAIDGPRVCRHCHEDWPCDAAILAAENERLREALSDDWPCDAYLAATEAERLRRELRRWQSSAPRREPPSFAPSRTKGATDDC